MFKKLIPCLLLTLLCCTACGETCTHKFTEETVAEATCATQGIVRKTCALCGHTEEIKLPKNDRHTFVSQITKEATCTSEGAKTEVCSACAETQEGVIPPLAHQYKEQGRTPATCKKEGSVIKVCSRCEDIQTEKLPITGHQYKETSRTAATCEKTGKVVKTCSGCGDKQTETLPVAGHKWMDYTCTAPMTCSVCKKTEGDKGPHDTLQGSCGVCGAQIDDLETVIAPALLSIEANLSAAKDYGSKYRTDYPGEANAFYLSHAFASAYTAIDSIVDIYNTLLGNPAYSQTSKEYLAAYELRTHIDPESVTAANAAAKYADYTKYFTQIEKHCNAAYAALHKEANVQGINLSDYFTPGQSEE